MSGEKRTYVSVEDRELRRLREQESRLRSLSQDLPERLDAVRRQAEKEMKNRLAPIEKRQKEYEKTVNNLQSELGDLERKTQQRLVQQQKEFSGRLDSQRGEYLSLIKEQDQRHTAMVEEEKQARQQAVNRLQGQISSIVDDASRKNDIARSFVVDLTEILEETDCLPHQRFAPGGMDKVTRHVDDARRSLDMGMADASLATAQSAYWELADLRADVLSKEREFMLVHQAAIQAARELLEEAQSNRKHQLEVGKGADMSVHELEVDHWTRGELSTFEKELSGLDKRLIDGKETLTIKEARQILEDLDSMKSRSAEIVEHACKNILASQVRCNIAELATEALLPEGFDMVDAAYDGNDERNAYVVKVRNIAGSEVVTVITPVDGEYGKNEVSIHSHDKTFVDESVLMQRSCEIVEVLKGQGLLAGNPQCMGDADQSCFDIDAVRRKGLKKTRTSSASARR
jgi:hypothetical protein